MVTKVGRKIACLHLSEFQSLNNEGQKVKLCCEIPGCCVSMKGSARLRL